MKRLSNPMLRFTSVAVTIGLAAAITVPAAALAEHAKTSDSASSAADGKFCTSLSAKATATTSKISDLTTKVNQAWSAQDQKLASEEQAVDQKVATDRSTADSTRATDFSKLEAKATTSAEKQAVQTYETAVKNAVDARRAAYDTARQTFRTGVKGAIAARRSTVTTQLSSFSSSVSSAFTTAENDCSTGSPSSATIHNTLVAALKTARETFQSDRKNDATVGSQVKQLAASRDAAFKQADATFQAAMTAARNALKTAFGSQSSSV